LAIGQSGMQKFRRFPDIPGKTGRRVDRLPAPGYGHLAINAPCPAGEATSARLPEPGTTD
jgi:hypothetical protein